MRTFLSLMLSLDLPFCSPIQLSLMWPLSLTSDSHLTFRFLLSFSPNYCPIFFLVSLPSIPDSLILPLSFIISPFLPFPLPISFPSLSLPLYSISNFPIFRDHQLVFLCIFLPGLLPVFLFSHLSPLRLILLSIVSLISLLSFCFLPRLSHFSSLFLPLKYFSVFPSFIQ